MNFPEKIDQETMVDIEILKNEFPYCSTLQSLYLKGLQNSGSVFFEKQLSKASLMSNDRARLYALCYQKKLQTIIDQVEQISHLDNDYLPQINNEEIVVSEESNEIPISDVINEIPEEDVKTVFRDAQFQSLEEDILLEAINNSIQLDVEEEIEELLLEENLDALASHEDQTDVLNTHQLQDSSIDIRDQKDLKPKKFSDWLIAMKPLEEPNEVPKLELAEKKDKALASPKDLIDRFLKVENKKISVSKEAITPQQMARLSLVENEDFVTETLANIYASQGNYLKSIKIYEQLMLTIPEKKVFFASRIRFLKEKLEYEP